MTQEHSQRCCGGECYEPWTNYGLQRYLPPLPHQEEEVLGEEGGVGFYCPILGRGKLVNMLGEFYTPVVEL
jgi:hypothetical protein